MNTATTAPRRFRSLLALPALSLLMACPPIEPPVGPGPRTDEGQRLRSGLWMLELSGVEAEGACGELDLRELDGVRIESWLELERQHAVMDMEGVVLRGSYDGRWLDLAGTLDPDVGVVVVEEDEDEEALPGTDDGEDTGAPPPCVDEPAEDEGRESHEGLWVELEAQALAPDRIEGVVLIDYDLPELRCTLSADLSGAYLARGGAHPEEAEPLVDDDDRDWDEDDGDDGWDEGDDDRD